MPDDFVDRYLAGRQVNVYGRENTHMNPDWVLVGTKIHPRRTPQGYTHAVYASTTLTRAELTAITEDVDVIDVLAPPPRPLVARIDLIVGMKNFYVSYGHTYAEAMHTLLVQHGWNPDDSERRQLNPGDDDG